MFNSSGDHHSTVSVNIRYKYMCMIYTVYKTVNTTNGHFYIGVHKTTNPNDDYLGSGTRLRTAIKKYGKHLFQKIVLAQYNTSEEAFNHERELITEQLCRDDICYNLKAGGLGGWDHISPEQCREQARRNLHTPEAHRRFRELGVFSSEKQRARRKSKPVTTGCTFYRDIEKVKASFRKIQHQRGAKNSQYGSCWITDGEQNRKIQKTETVPTGWIRGRKI